MLKFKPTVYLAGSIDGHDSWDTVTEWRNYASLILEAVGYRVLNPTRGRSRTTPYDIFIVERDLEDIDCADILLVEMNHENRAYIGTSMEIRYAWERHKEIIVWGTANTKSHWLKYHTNQHFKSLDGALLHLKERQGEEEYGR